MLDIFINAVSDDGVKVDTKLSAGDSTNAILELEVIVENQTDFDLVELKLEGCEGEAVRLLTLPFFDNVRQLGELKPHQKSTAQLFRFRRHTSADNSQATVIFKLFGQLQATARSFATSISVSLLI
jgi:hypothetical protein